MLDDTRDHPQKPATAPAQNSEAPGPGRHPNSLANLERHKFQPGQSGNPGGRPKKIREVADIALDGSVKAINALIAALDIEMAKDEPNPRTIAMLSDKIMDRGLGRAAQSLDVTQETKHTLSEEFETIVRQLQDRKNPEVQALINRSKAIDIDFDNLD